MRSKPRERPRSIACALFVALVVAIAAVAPTVYANDPATAQALFDQARKLMTQERWAEACPKLEESQRLDPGGGTLLHLALCREHEGRIATAWAHYQDALSAAKRDGRKDRAKIAQARIDKLKPRLPRMRIRVASHNRSLSGFRVTRDEANVGEAQWNETFPVDPGTHTVTAFADGYKAWTSKLEIASAPRETRVDVPELEIDPDVQRVPVATVPPHAPAALPSESARGDTQRSLGIVVGGVGLVGVTVGSVFGVLAISKEKEADDNCKAPDFRVCTAEGKAAGDDAMTQGNISTIAFVTGGVFVAAGAVLYLTAPDPKRRVGLVPSLHSRGGGLSIGGSF